MARLDECETLEDLFYNREDLTGWEVLQWLRMRGVSGEDLVSQTAVTMTVYDGWKQGLFLVEGDVVGLREWKSN